ncbi:MULTISPECIES: efflux transporter outer membrane subunit [Pseudomonas]|uniref:Efflux transporter outer membrane subunit n=1 Tax=Pseudomonas izuensis TaxID=2684212 RepID=A0ABM7RRN6_9PSED|nr:MULTISPECIES: efflux transporter outer membrane subunit [Pseudomonas]RKS27549.1 multidrug efflux system outer membrane protein [Pseudomonas sp. WPR_5_2]BCX68310.1 efflux transporter outer membrane subunit [Pseudomonas izuensis]
MRKPPLPLLLCLGLFGCMVGPDYQPPEIDTPAAYRYADKEARDLSNTLWWEQFQDPVLNDLIRTALQENKDIKIAAARVEQFQGRYGETRSLLFPQVGLDAQGQRSRSPRDNGPVPLDPSVDPVFNNYQALLSVNWELDVWGRLRRLSESARADLLASEEGRRSVILSLVSSVATSYVTLRDLDRELEISRTTAKARGDSYEIFKLRFGAGVISEMELAQNQSEYERTLASVAQFEPLVAQQENALAVLLGRNPGPILRGRDLGQLALPSVPAGLPSDLLQRRPDLHQAELNLISANAQIGAAKAQYFPTISLTGLLGSVSNQLSNLFTGPAATWSYGVAASMPIFTAGGIAGQVQQAEAFQQQTLLTYQQAIQSAFRDVENALIASTKSREQMAYQDRQVEALRTYAHYARLRYDNGYTSYIEVLDAERSLFDAELNYTRTRATVFTSMIDLYKATGGGWVTKADELTVSGQQHQ